MKWNNPVYPPTEEKILRNYRGNIDLDCPKRHESQPSMTCEQYALIKVVCAMQANPCYTAMPPRALVEAALSIVQEMTEQTRD